MTSILNYDWSSHGGAATVIRGWYSLLPPATQDQVTLHTLMLFSAVKMYNLFVCDPLLNIRWM